MKRIFITGATGVLGKRVVAELSSKGYDLTILVRSKSESSLFDSTNIKVVEGNIFDLNQMEELTQGANAIFHLATRIPQKSMPSKKDWVENDRLRIDATKILLTCCERNGISRFMLPSVAFLYGDQQGKTINSQTPLPTKINGLMQSAFDMEKILMTAKSKNIDYCIIRYGVYYSADSYHTVQMLSDVQKGKMPIIGDGGFFMNIIHVDDAASAMVYAFENFETFKNKILNASDFHPITYKELVGAIQRTVNGKNPFRLPKWIAKILLGKDRYEYITASYKIERDNEWKNWKIKHPDFSKTIAEIYQEIKGKLQ
jgi:nucleoside-diphosphate-sugar epimerase